MNNIHKTLDLQDKVKIENLNKYLTLSLEASKQVFHN